jgi:hypothetical protein
MHRVLTQNRKERVHLEDLGVDGRIILKWILKIYVVERGLGLLAQGMDKW